MKGFLSAKGKRIGAVFLAVLLLLGAVPHIDDRTVLAAEDTVTEETLSGNVVTMNGTVYTPGDMSTSYSGAEVTVTYADGKTASATTDGSGKYQIEIADWTLTEGDTYGITVSPAVADSMKYEQKSLEGSVTADHVASGQINIADITLEMKEYKISYTITDGGKMILNQTDEYGAGSGEAVVAYASPYEIKAAVTDETLFHLTSVKVDGEEKLTSSEVNNDCNEKVIPFADGMTGDMVVEITAEADTCQITINKTGEGTVSSTEGVIENDSVSVNAGTDLILDIVPGTDHSIKNIRINDTDIPETDCTDQGDGSYQYTLTAVQEDKKVEVTFEPILVVPQDFADTGILLQDENGDTLELNEENTCCAKSVVMEAGSGKHLRLEESGMFAKEVMLTETKTIETIYLRSENPDAFGTDQKIVLTAPVRFVIDTDKPSVRLDENPIWKSPADTVASITGTAGDSNLSRVVWSATRLDPDSDKDTILNDTVNVIVPEVNGSFAVEVKLAEGQDTDQYYLYAVDEADNISDPAEVTVYRDGTAPEISDVTITPQIHSYSFGNFGNTEVTLQVAANDGSKASASGIEKINVYAKDTLAYTGTISGDPVAGGAGATIEVKIPAEADAAFAVLSELGLTAVDAMGNESAKYDLTAFAGVSGAGISDNRLMLEKDKPEISIEPSNEADNPVYVEKTSGETLFWYKEIPETAYKVTDRKDGVKGSGIAERSVFLNGIQIDSKTDYTTVVSDHEAVVQEDDGTVTSGQLAAMTEGQNTLEVRFRDLAGNDGSNAVKLCLDRHDPRITGFSIEDKSGAADKLLRLIFGNYASGEVQITVSAEDSQDENGQATPSSGVKEITLYLDGVAYETRSVKDGQAVFTLPGEEILAGTEKVYLDKIVTASVSDNVGNTSEICDMTTGNSNIESSRLMIETVKPKVTVTPVKAEYVDADGKIYNNSDTEMNVNVSDQHSGLRHVMITVNGTEVEDKVFPEDAKQEQDAYTVNTKDAAVSPEGSYEVEITVIDNAGNEKVSTSKIYKDTTAPEIMRFEMQAEGNAEADGTELSFSEMDYGYYFHEDTKVTVYATDGSRDGDSGVKEILYYTVDLNGTKSSTVTLAANADGAVSFVIPAEFKGQVYACANDHLSNSTGKYVTPESLIIETPEQHEKEEHIAYDKAAAPYRDQSGKELYADNVAVDVSVTDTFSGIRKVEWSVTAPYDTALNQSGMIELDNDGNFVEGNSTDGWSKTGTEKNIVTGLRKTFTVANNSNDIVVSVVMTDRAGNVSEKQTEFSIDKTNPAIRIDFDNETPDAENTEMYQENRVATITVTERNFDEAEFVVDITNTDGVVPAISEWSTAVNSGNPDETVSTATITFSEDGDYTLEVSGRDMADHPAETVKADDFTIDKTEPVITVSYDNDNALNGNYYAAERTATIQIEEHNFSAERVKITGTATDNGTAISFPPTGGWSESGDVHTATIICGSDGLYRFDVEYTDMAGNPAEDYTGEEYYVDMTEPEIEITGVEDMSANNGDVAPRVVMTDTNYDVNGVTIELTGANQGNVTPDGAYTAQGNGQTFTFRNFPQEQGRDDIYTLTATLTDLAGNESTDTVTFSVNRFGSVYVFDDSLKNIEGTYIQNEIDVRLTEVNVDSLEHDKIRVVVDTNGTPEDLVEGVDYTVRQTGGNGNWYQYEYTIDKSLFAGDGRYIVTLYSEDAAGNINENIDESKQAEISFGVDKTAPVVIPIDIESDAQYAVDTKNATVTVNDNLVLENVEVYVGDRKCEYTTEGENYTFEIPGASSRQDITVSAVDAAGNRTNYIISDVLITTNAFIRWYNNKLLFAGTIIGVVALGVGGIGLGFALRSGKIKVRRRNK